MSPEPVNWKPGGAYCWLAGKYWLGTLNRLESVMSSAVPLMWSAPGLMMLSRLVASISNRSTCGVNMTPAGKWPFNPIGATRPGPRSGELGSVMFGSDWTSLWVIVDCAICWTVREVKGPWSLAKKAPVRASEIAPSIE